MDAGFDFVAMGRALLREPDLVNRLQSAAADSGICIHCNRCMPTIYSGTRCPVRTTLNDLTPSAILERVLVWRS